jgi:prepilin-type processing-associated H-X9-DG protein
MNKFITEAAFGVGVFPAYDGVQGKMERIPDPCRLLVLFELWISPSATAGYNYEESWYGGSTGNFESTTIGGDVTIRAWRHNKGMNVLFSDGHVDRKMPGIGLEIDGAIWCWKNGIPRIVP